MATIPIKESGDSWSFRDGNVPFALENAVYTSGDDTLTATVGAGRARWGDTVYELAAATNDFTATAPTAGTYYVYVDHSAQTVSVSQTAPGPGDSPIAELQFDGTSVTSSTDARSFTPQATGLLTQDGSPSRPAWAFDSNPDTGIYLGAGSLGLVVNSSEVGTLDSGGLDIAGGLTANDITVDSLTLNGDDITSSSGMTLDASGDLYFRTFGSTRGFYDDSLDAWRWYNGGIGEVIRMDGGDLRMVGGGQIRLEDGSPSAPALAFDGDPNTGLYTSAQGSINLVSNGVNGLILTDSFVSADVQARFVDGSRTDPAITFSTSVFTGWWNDNSLSRVYGVCDGANQHLFTAQDFAPGESDEGANPKQLGNSVFRWAEVWAVNGNIQTSDERTKHDVSDDDLGLEFVRALRPLRFRRNGGTRPHRGFAAQQVKEAMSAVGTDDFAGFIDPSVDPPDPAKWPEAYDDDGNLTAAMGLRYDEFVGPLAKAVQELADELDALRAEVDALQPA